MPKLSIEDIRAKHSHHFLAAIISQSAHLREYHQSEADRYAAMLAAERKFRDEQMEADRVAFMGPDYWKGVTVPEPEPAQMPVAPDVGEPLTCRNCRAATEGDEPRYTDLCVYPQGRWRRDRQGWLHHCAAGVWSEAVNPFAAEGL